MHFICSNCALAISKEVIKAQPHQYKKTVEDGAITIDAGLYHVLENAEFNQSYDNLNGTHKVQISSNGAYALNPNDIIRDNISSYGKDYGCCGSDGCDGPNRICVCGNILGTEWSDCWTRHEIRLEPNAVKLV